MGPIASKMKSSSQSPVFITVMWSLTISSTTDCMIWVTDSLTTSLTISADTLTAGSLLDRELLKNKKIHKRDISCVVIFRCFFVLWCGYCSVSFQSFQHQETIRFLSVTSHALCPRAWPFSVVFWVVVWVLLSVFSIFCITSFVDCTRKQQQETTPFSTILVCVLLDRLRKNRNCS